MGRTLPWLTHNGSRTQPSRNTAPHSPSSTRTPKRRRLLTPPSRQDSNTDGPTTLSGRPPSSSPPIPQQGPIHPDPMRTGYDADDKYIMVEDEFLSTAQSYTRGLHRAEYKRLRARVSEPPSARFTSQPPTVLEARREAHEAAMADLDQDLGLLDPLLKDLMESPRKRKQLSSLSRNMRVGGETARGENVQTDIRIGEFAPVDGNVETDSEGDLDLVTRPPARETSRPETLKDSEKTVSSTVPVATLGDGEVETLCDFDADLVEETSRAARDVIARRRARLALKT